MPSSKLKYERNAGKLQGRNEIVVTKHKVDRIVFSPAFHHELSLLTADGLFGIDAI
jgi:hypothetical protein